VDKEVIIEVILRARNDLTREHIISMAKEKMKSIGAGYLTEQGALFLVAADLGVKIDHTSIRKDITGLKDLYAGARDINVTARVLKIYPLKRFMKSDGKESMLRIIKVYDDDTVVRVNLWDEQAMLVDDLRLKVGDAIRMDRVYVRSTMDNTLAINSSSNTTITKIDSKIKDVHELSLHVDDIASSSSRYMDMELVVDGLLASNPIISSYSRDGSRGNILRLTLQGYNGSKANLVVWDINMANVAKIIPINSRVMVVGVRVKRRDGGMELHGDAGTAIIVDNDHTPDVIRFNVLAVTDDRRYGIIADDLDGIFVMDAKVMPEGVDEGMCIECIPSMILGYTVYIDEDSYVRVVEEYIEVRPTKIADIKEEGRLYVVEGVILATSMNDMVLKDGRSALYASMLIGDDTSEIRVTAWDKQSDSIKGLNIGDRVRIYGAIAKRRGTSDNDGYELVIRPYTIIRIIGDSK
jgi:hypothetical protein